MRIQKGSNLLFFGYETNRECTQSAMYEPSEVEKYAPDRRSSSADLERDSYSSSYLSSSRETSGSYRPMLHKTRKRRKRSPFYRIPNNIVRYLCLALISTVIIFILSLIRASYTSSRQLEIGLVEQQAARPPPWESFEILQRYFGGVRSLVLREKNVPEYPRDQEDEERHENFTVAGSNRKGLPRSIPFNPYPEYSSDSYLAKYEEKHECFLDAENHIRTSQVHSYVGVPQGLPDAALGSYSVLGLRDDICFERFGRLGPYGYGYSARRGGTGAGLNGDREGSMDIWTEDKNITEVDYSKVNWAEAQSACASKNRKRFKLGDQHHQNLFQDMHTPQEQISPAVGKSHKGKREATDKPELVGSNSTEPRNGPSVVKEVLPRTAIILRAWWDMEYSPEIIIYLRSLITELSLLSGGEYTVHFLIHVRDDNVPIWADQHIYDRILENSLPKEFRGMGTLWSERQMSLIYGGLQESFFRNLPVHGVYRGTYLPLQYFSHQHPEYEHLWNWEMDVRYTGQWYHLLDKVREWTKAQPRKGLWERNGRFYIPSVHGSWEDFRQMVRVQTEMGTDHPNNLWAGLNPGSEKLNGGSATQSKGDTPIWGPLSPPDVLQGQDDLLPRTSFDKDKYEWGVGEEADLITFNPIFDPDGTTWFFTEDITGYNTTVGLPPRRAAITTTSRLSRRLLQTMHRETVLARHLMFSEMWPASCALHHGFKAVYAPHPVYLDRNWPTAYLAGVMNGGRNGASGGARTSVFGSREHNFRGTTWFYDAAFSARLWRRWLGYKVDNNEGGGGGGGEQAEMAGEGRMCLPGVLLHPVKGVELVVEGVKHVGGGGVGDGGGGVESGPDVPSG